METQEVEKSDPVYKLLKQVKKLTKGKQLTERYINKLIEIPKIMKTCGSVKRKIIIGCLSYILFNKKDLKIHLYNFKLIIKKNDIIYFNPTEANLEQFRMSNQHYKTERRSSKLYYTEISTFPHGNLKIIDISEINEMASELDFKEFPDPSFYYIWTYERQKIKVNTKNEEGDNEDISISLESISDQGNWGRKQVPVKDQIAEIEANEKDSYFDPKIYKMSIFDKIEYLKNTGKINYEDYTIKSAVALNSKRFQNYKVMRDNMTTMTAAKNRAISNYRTKKFSNRSRVIDFSEKINNSFYGSNHKEKSKEDKFDLILKQKKEKIQRIEEKKEAENYAETLNYNISNMSRNLNVSRKIRSFSRKRGVQSHHLSPEKEPKNQKREKMIIKSKEDQKREKMIIKNKEGLFNRNDKLGVPTSPTKRRRRDRRSSTTKIERKGNNLRIREVRRREGGFSKKLDEINKEKNEEVNKSFFIKKRTRKKRKTLGSEVPGSLSKKVILSNFSRMGSKGISEKRKRLLPKLEL